jgi:hypothetical protein
MGGDQTLVHEMEAVIREFEAGRLSFRTFLDRLEVCADHLSDEDIPWREALQREWGRLEDAYAHASFRGLKAIPERDIPAVVFALKEVKRLVTEKTARRA